MTDSSTGGRVVVERDEDAVTLTISNPRRRNAMSYAMYAVIEKTCTQAAADPSVRAVVLRGAGGHFAGGTDITELEAITTGELGVAYEHYMSQVHASLLALRVPLIAVVEGVCVGGGLVLAALSDIVYCTPDAQFGAPMARTLGNTLSATAMSQMHTLFGRRLATRMLFTAALIGAEDAERAGFVTSVIPKAELEGALADSLESIRRCAPETIWSYKELACRLDRDLSEVLVDDVYERVYGGPDFREGLSAFLEKRTPNFTGRR